MGEKPAQQHELEGGEKITTLGSKIPFGKTRTREGKSEAQGRVKIVVLSLDYIRITLDLLKQEFYR